MKTRMLGGLYTMQITSGILSVHGQSFWQKKGLMYLNITMTIISSWSCMLIFITENLHGSAKP